MPQNLFRTFFTQNHLEPIKVAEGSFYVNTFCTQDVSSNLSGLEQSPFLSVHLRTVVVRATWLRRCRWLAQCRHVVNCLGLHRTGVRWIVVVNPPGSVSLARMSVLYSYQSFHNFLSLTFPYLSIAVCSPVALSTLPSTSHWGRASVAPPIMTFRYVSQLSPFALIAELAGLTD